MVAMGRQMPLEQLEHILVVIDDENQTTGPREPQFDGAYALAIKARPHLRLAR